MYPENLWAHHKRLAILNDLVCSQEDGSGWLNLEKSEIWCGLQYMRIKLINHRLVHWKPAISAPVNPVGFSNWDSSAKTRGGKLGETSLVLSRRLTSQWKYTAFPFEHDLHSWWIFHIFPGLRKKTEENSVRLERIWNDSLVKFETSKNIGD